MADAVYDAIVVGGGHHGTIIGCYLQKAGLKTAIFERQMEIGGGACAEDLPAPGFLQNTCAHFTRFWAHPAYKDFSLPDKGLTYVFPDGNQGMVFDDETCYIGYSCLRVDPETGLEEFSQAHFDKTYGEISRFSTRDADAYARLFVLYRDKWRPAFREYRYNPPTPWGTPNALERLLDDPESGIEPVHQFMNGKQIAYDLFESPELRTLFMRALATSVGCYAHDVIGIHGLIHTTALVFSWESASIALGGSHSISHALQRAFSEMGGKFFVQHEVDKVLVENGTAVGVRLVDGSEIKATRLVVSDLGIPQTMFRLLGEEYLTAKQVHRVKNIDYERIGGWWGNIAVHELPKYKAAAYNPDCGMQPRLYVGHKDPDYAQYYQAHVMTEGWGDRLLMLTGPDSIWDPTRAPEGKHTIVVEEMAPPLRFYSEREWLRKKKEFVASTVQKWQQFAPNMTMDNVIDAFITCPYDVVQRHPDMIEGSWVQGSMFASQLDRFRPCPEFSDYRTPVKNLYTCSASLHSAQGIGRGSSYAAYKVIAQEHGLTKFWEGRAY
jgi:beta-carotene ketolase (CrtO type)